MHCAGRCQKCRFLQNLWYILNYSAQRMAHTEISYHKIVVCVWKKKLDDEAKMQTWIIFSTNYFYVIQNLIILKNVFSNFILWTKWNSIFFLFFVFLFYKRNTENNFTRTSRPNGISLNFFSLKIMIMNLNFRLKIYHFYYCS